MYKFPKGLYVDVRIEETFDTKISFKKLTLEEQKIRTNKGAFIRVFDGRRWYYSSTTDINGIQAQIDTLAEMAAPNPDILEHPIVKAFEVNQETILQYEAKSVTNIPVEEKQRLLESYLALIRDPVIVHHSSFYADNKTIKSIYTSKGTAVTFDKQTCGIRINLELSSGENKNQTSASTAGVFFRDLLNLENFFQTELEKSVVFTRDAEPVIPGEYPVLLSPEATGVFTHESFGHKSESDFMVGDETMKAEWTLGKRIGRDLLTIIDDGTILGNGYVPYDDEGTKGKKTYIITNGILSGRLHSIATAAQLEEPLTGSVFGTLAEVDAVSEEFELISSVGGGCGKMEQWRRRHPVPASGILHDHSEVGAVMVPSVIRSVIRSSVPFSLGQGLWRLIERRK